MESEIMVYIPGYNEYPLAKVLKWMAGYEERLNRLRAAQQKAIPNFEEYLKNNAQPLIDGYIKSLNPEFVSRSGLNAKQLIRRMRSKVFSKEAYEKYCQGLSVEKLMDKLPLKSATYAAKMTFGRWRLEGGLTADGPSALKIIIRWLGGDKKITSALRKQDKLLKGGPVQIIPTERAGEFKLKLRTLLKSGFNNILNAHYAPSAVSEENDRLGQLVDRYQCPEFMVSINWTVIPESVTPADSKEILDIKYKIYQFFRGEEQAKDLRRTSIEREYHYPLNPAEYIGHPDQPAYFDMYLDISVASA
jgi:hypothetical protein